MKLVVFGTSAFAVPVLQAVQARYPVVAVVTQPDRPAGRGQQAAPTPLKQAAEALGLRVLTPPRLRDFAAEAQALGAGAFVVASYGRIVPQTLLDVVPIAFNVHPSLLPLYRGATPLQSAIRDGRTETGVTIIAMDAGMDTGDVLVRERTPLGPAETYGELHDRLAAAGARLVLEALDRYAAGTLTRTPQAQVAADESVDEAEIAATRTRPLHKDDLRIRWSDARARVLDTVRAFAPQPLARVVVDDDLIKIAAARAADPSELAPEAPPSAAGPFLIGGKRAFFGGVCGDGGLVALERVIAPGRGIADGATFARARFERRVRAGSAR